MSSIKKDKAYLEVGIPELGDYLLSKELYWPINARGYSLPRLTIGGTLLASARLDARGEKTESLWTQLDEIRNRWQTAWETKAGREVGARLRLWDNYLADYRHDPRSHANAYPHEVHNRLMLQLLINELSTLPPEQATLSQLDSMLRTRLLPGEFIWETDIEAGFPREVYWYLYGKLKM